MPRISAVRTGGLMCLVNVGFSAAGAAIRTLPGKGGRSKRLLEITPFREPGPPPLLCQPLAPGEPAGSLARLETPAGPRTREGEARARESQAVRTS
jgi:hypothetical protein